MHAKENGISGGLTLEPLDARLSVCKVSDYAGVDVDAPFVFAGRTDREKSLVCPEALVPEGVLEREDGWRAFRVRGQLDFSLIGILAGITRVLAENGIGVFVLSTFDTDYVLVKDAAFRPALNALASAGYTIAEG